MMRFLLMRILLDEQLPRQLAQEIPNHEVRTVQQQGWAGLGNGELLRRAAAAGFEILSLLTKICSFSRTSADRRWASSFWPPGAMHSRIFSH
jgi:hypothetical protein